MIIFRHSITEYLIVWLILGLPLVNYAMLLEHHTDHTAAAATTEACSHVDTDDENELDLPQDSAFSKEDLHQLLVTAINSGNTETARQLIALKADVHHQPPYDPSQNKPLERSALRPVPVATPINPVGSMMRIYTSIPHNPSDWTPLMHAAHGRFADIAQLLIDSKASVHARTKDGQTALHILLYASKTNNEHYQKPKNRDIKTYGYTATSQTLVFAGARLNFYTTFDSDHWKFALPHVQASIRQAADSHRNHQWARILIAKNPRFLELKKMPDGSKPPLRELPAALVQYILTFLTHPYERETIDQTDQSSSVTIASTKKNNCVIL